MTPPPACGLPGTLAKSRSRALKPATQKICAALGLDPFRLLSSGAMLIACPDGETLANGLMQMGINAAVIGRAGGKGVRTANGEAIAPPGADELYKLYK